MKTSTAGRAAIERREGRRLRAYRDTRGILTIGVGHTGRMSQPSVTAGMTISETECDDMLARDLAPVERVIAAAVTVPLTQNEFDALASLGFNIGAAGLKGSSAIRKLNAGDVHGAADAFMNWCKPAVLTARREAERQQFLAEDVDLGAVANARAGVLSARSARAAHVAAQAAAVATTAPVASAATVAVIHAAHPAVAVTGGLAALAASAATGAAAWLASRRAALLARNVAAAHRRAAA